MFSSPTTLWSVHFPVLPRWLFSFRSIAASCIYVHISVLINIKQHVLSWDTSKIQSSRSRHVSLSDLQKRLCGSGLLWPNSCIEMTTKRFVWARKHRYWRDKPVDICSLVWSVQIWDLCFHLPCLCAMEEVWWRGGAFPGTRNQHLIGPLLDHYFFFRTVITNRPCEGFLSNESDWVLPGMTCPPKSPDLSRGSRRRWSAERRQMGLNVDPSISGDHLRKLIPRWPRV